MHQPVGSGKRYNAIVVYAYPMDDSSSDTSIRVSRDTWHRLNQCKEPGKSFDDIINELLDAVEERDTGNRMLMAEAIL